MAKSEEKKKKPTASKRDIQNANKRQRNRAYKSQVKTAIRAFYKSATNNEPKNILQTEINSIYSLIDKGVKKKIFKKNKAARIKSRISTLSKGSAQPSQ